TPGRRRPSVAATSHLSTPRRGGTSSAEGLGMRAGQAPGFLTVQGLSLRVSVEGRGQPLLLISGLGASLDVWEPLRDALPGFETIAFDIPGVGESPFPSWPLTIPRLARLTAGVVGALGYDQV